eukprot:5590228-Amphidinium_carterae.1
MKQCFPGKAMRQKLLEGVVVVKFAGKHADGIAVDHYFHISAMYLSPYRPTFLHLLSVDCPAYESSADHRRVHLQVSGK